jgi:hypothetical protein
MAGNVLRCKATDSSPIICVSPQVLHDDKLTVQKGEDDTYSDCVLSSGTNPRRFHQPEGHVGGFVQCVYLRHRQMSLKESTTRNTNEHNYCPVLALSTPILCRVWTVKRPVRLYWGEKRQIGIRQMQECKTYVDTPPERHNCGTDDWILVDINNFRVFENRQRFVCNFRHLPSKGTSDLMCSKIAWNLTSVP